MTNALRRRLLAQLATIACATLLGVAHATPTVFDLDRVGAPAPPIAVPLADGTMLPLASLRGKPTYVFLFASWCEPCSIAMPWIRAAYAAYGDRVQFVGIDVLDAHDAAEAYVRAQHLPFDVGIIDKNTIDAVVDDDARLAGGTKYELPADYVLDANGVVRDAWHGIPVDRDGSPLDVLPDVLAKIAP